MYSIFFGWRLEAVTIGNEITFLYIGMLIFFVRVDVMIQPFIFTFFPDFWSMRKEQIFPQPSGFSINQRRVSHAVMITLLTAECICAIPFSFRLL